MKSKSAVIRKESMKEKYIFLGQLFDNIFCVVKDLIGPHFFLYSCGGLNAWEIIDNPILQANRGVCSILVWSGYKRFFMGTFLWIFKDHFQKTESTAKMWTMRETEMASHRFVDVIPYNVNWHDVWTEIRSKASKFQFNALFENGL